MSYSKHDDAYDRTAARQSRRRGKAAAGAVGLAALLGGTAYLITDQVAKRPETIATESGALSPLSAPSGPASSAPSAASSRADGVGSGATASTRMAPAASTSMSKSTAERIKEARANAAKHGVPLKHPLPAPAAPVPASAVTVTNSGGPGDAATLRVISARADLTGQRELGWVADSGAVVGSAHCSQTVRFSSNGKASLKPNLLICWRTSATRSVVTVMVSMDGHPSRKDSVAALNKRWAELA
jgi:hypothetical protein